MSVVVSLAALVFPAGATAAEPETPAAPAAAAAPAATEAPSAKPTAEPDNSGSSLKLLGGYPAAQAIDLKRGRDGLLRGTLVVPMRSEVNADGLEATYFPLGAAAAKAASVTLGPGFAQGLSKGRASSVTLVFTLPAGQSPDELSGIVELRPTRNGNAFGRQFELAVSSGGAPLDGISIQPEKVAIRVVGGLGEIGAPDNASAKVQLYGPGVPALFDGKAPSFNLLLRSDNGDEAHARLTELTQTGDPGRAVATVKVEGELGPGKFEGAAPLSSLSGEAPKLSVELESGNTFWLALLVVFVGAVAGGGLYLASNRRRRKALLRDQVKSLLAAYERTLEQMRAGHDGNVPLWTLGDYLGSERDKWYEVKWNAIADFDGAVRAIWSAIHWARDEDDLDEVNKQVEELRGRIIRWTAVARSIAALERAVELRPESLERQWRNQRTPADSARLLEQVRQIEPVDDKASKELIARIERQARWHVVMAEAWNARTLLALDMRADPAYGANDRDMLETLDLEALDRKAAPESERDAVEQIDLRLTLDGYMKKIRCTYRGDRGRLELAHARATDRLTEVDPALALTATAEVPAGAPGEGIAAMDFARAERKEIERPMLGDRLRGTDASDHDGKRIKVPASAIARRDAFWTAGIALVSSAAYMPTLYSPVWGTCLDYVGAFAAGFVGKAAISWAALPLFQSLRPSRRGGGPKTAAGGDPPDDGKAKKKEKDDPAGEGDEKPEPTA